MWNQLLQQQRTVAAAMQVQASTAAGPAELAAQEPKKTTVVHNSEKLDAPRQQA